MTSVTFNVKATTTTSSECDSYANTVTGSAGNQGDLTPKSATVTCQKPSVTLTKTTQAATVDAGDPISFTITATNSSAAGTGTANGVVIKDDLPGDVQWTTQTPGCTITGAIGSQKLACAAVDLAAGEAASATVTASTSFTKCATYTNSATLSSVNAPDATSNQATITCHKPAVTLSKQAQDTAVDAGDAIRFTITASNAGAAGTGTAKGVVITDALPGNVDWSTDDGRVHGHGRHRLAGADVRPGHARRRRAHAVVVGATTTFAGCAVYDNTAGFSSANSGSGQSNKATIICRKPATIRIDKLVTGRSRVHDEVRLHLGPDAERRRPGTTFALSAADAPMVFTVRPDGRTRSPRTRPTRRATG